jgi:hypothetical protein
MKKVILLQIPTAAVKTKEQVLENIQRLCLLMPIVFLKQKNTSWIEKWTPVQ